MRTLKLLAAAFAALLVSFSLVAPATAARVYNFDTNTWETQAEAATTRRAPRGSSIPREIVAYSGKERPGTIIVETSERRLYLVLEDGKAMKYGVGVGRDGFRWAGTHKITRKAEWPGWTPPPAMRKRQPELPAFMPGGPDNPLGARALYIGSTLYRLHGTSEPWTIGHAVSSGCIRLTNEDVIDLYERARVGATVIVRH
ncbi:L,D-transpeptidase [Arsenicitalea aurantiaca]|uniref:L,D-transpeptidase n=1 Tax=Arsenicitalea aurantiaca TaxID=1783274 RepID=A0A433X9Z5_9HYPH|nr:L,D-transpeptidase [Arsenicitalea aurantiaca]RUT30947.1 L,D-transpeptidase [Arsenicitalea aurantiaca]